MLVEPDHADRVNTFNLVVRGEMRRLWTSRAREVLCEGPAGTGKSFVICAYIISLCMQYPNIRVLLARKTRTSMTQSILVTWERMLKHLGLSSVCSGAGRPNRTRYQFPNGSEAVVFGFDDPERIKSSEYDLIYVNEATELTLEDWEVAISRLRNNMLPWQQAIADCNPGAPNHWLNQRANTDAMLRLRTRHVDNPWLYQNGEWTDVGREYISRLDALTGARKSRLRYGQWVAAEGAVFEEVWDATKHIVRAAPEHLRSHIAGVDWGYRHPGVIQVWACDGDGRMYRLREIYHSGKTIDWWLKQAKFIQRDFPSVRKFICDPSQPAHIEQFIMAGIPARGADRSNIRRQDILMPNPLAGSLEVGLQIMEERLRGDETGPRMFFVENATGWYDDDGNWIIGRDQALIDRGWPACTEDEFSLYSFPKGEDGKPLKEAPVPLYDDGIDAARYVATHYESHEVTDEVLAPIRMRF